MHNASFTYNAAPTMSIMENLNSVGVCSLKSVLHLQEINKTIIFVIYPHRRELIDVPYDPVVTSPLSVTDIPEQSQKENSQAIPVNLYYEV